MQRARDKLLAGAALAGDEDAGLACRRTQDLAEQIAHDRAMTHQSAKTQPVAGRFFQLHLMGTIAQHHGAVSQSFIGGQYHGPHAQGNQRAIRTLHDEVLDLLPLHCVLHERAMSAFIAAPRAGRPLKEAGTQFVQDLVVVLAQHPAGRLIDCHDMALLIEKKNPLFEIVEKLS